MDLRRVRTRSGTLGVAVLLFSAGLFTGCSSSGQSHAMAPGAMNAEGYMAHPAAMPMGGTMLPDFATATPQMQKMYTLALQNPKLLSYMPCTCGCASMGHLSNWNCYVKSVSSTGVVTFDSHATGCSTCLEITQDVLSMYRRGSPLSEIRDYIDANYTGEATPTEYPTGM
jgi:hypothetical protein